MQRAGEILVGFRLDEIGQDVGPGPAASALLRPGFVISGRSADIDHGVDGRRAAERLAARLVAATAAEALLRNRFEGPVVERRTEPSARPRKACSRPRNRPVRRLRARRRCRLRVFAQAAGDHAAGRPAADHDIVEFIHACRSPEKPNRPPRTRGPIVPREQGRGNRPFPRDHRIQERRDRFHFPDGFVATFEKVLQFAEAGEARGLAHRRQRRADETLPRERFERTAKVLDQIDLARAVVCAGPSADRPGRRLRNRYGRCRRRALRPCRRRDFPTKRRARSRRRSRRGRKRAASST